MIGSPTQNSCINSERLKVKYRYKLAIREAKTSSIRDNSDQINASLVNKDPSSFWKCWKSIYDKRNLTRSPPLIDNFSDHRVIAESFRTHFKDSFINSSDHTDAKNEFTDLLSHLHHDKSDIHTFQIEDVDGAVNQLALNKAVDMDELVGEHLFYSHPSILLHLKNLFNIMMSHSYVPHSFTVGIITPIVKDARGDLSSPTNYRPITISSVISKVFEYLILNRFSQLFSSDMLQFGYKPSMGCPNAIFLLRRVIQHFNDNSSNVYMASIDASSNELFSI